MSQQLFDGFPLYSSVATLAKLWPPELRPDTDTVPELDQHWFSSAGDKHWTALLIALQLHWLITAWVQLQSPVKPTFRGVPVDEGIHQRPAFAVVGCSQLQPISFQGAHDLALPGNAHGDCPLVVLTGQWVQRTTAWSPRVEEDHQP